MKNLMVSFLAVILVFSVVFLPLGKVSAESMTGSAQNTAALEIQLNTLQKELIVLLNEKIVILRAELTAVLERRLENLQLQLIGLLREKVSILQAELASK